MFLLLGPDRPLVVSVADGRSQAVVGKSRTTGSIYLTSVSSTIAKHHQRADGASSSEPGGADTYRD